MDNTYIRFYIPRCRKITFILYELNTAHSGKLKMLQLLSQLRFSVVLLHTYYFIPNLQKRKLRQRDQVNVTLCNRNRQIWNSNCPPLKF